MSTPGARDTRCDGCDFHFCSNHYPGAPGPAAGPAGCGSLEAVCVRCLRKYVLPTRSAWGASQAELLELHTLEYLHRTRADRRAGRSYRQLTGTGVLALFDREWYATGLVADVACPSCGAPESVAVEFIDGAACPACKAGILRCQPVIA